MNSNQFNTVFSVIIALVSIISVLFPKLIGLAFILWIITIITGVVRKEIKIIKPTTIFILFWSLFLMYLVGVIFTNHFDIAIKNIEYKLSLLVVPLLLIFQPKHLKFETIKWGFIYSVVLLGIAQLTYLLMNGSFSQGKSAFTSSNFSTIHHPTYFSAFAFLAMIFSIQLFSRAIEKQKKILLFCLILFFILIQMMCLALAGLLFLMLFFTLYACYFSFKKFGKKGLIIAIVIVPIMMVSTIRLVPGFKIQFDVSKQFWLEYMESPTNFVESKKTYIGGNETRLILWTATYQEILIHPFGVGTGNVDDYIESRLNLLGQQNMALKKYNPHNQYLQTALEIGIIGSILLIIIVGYTIYYGVKSNNWILVLLTLNLGFNCLFESMLQRQSGIVFYVFWLLILTLIDSTKLLKEKKIR